MRIILVPLAASILAALGSTHSVLANQNRCRCLSDDECWPDASAFDQLQSLLSHPLLYPEPTASPCYPQLTNGSSAACQAVKSNWGDGQFRAHIVGSMESPNWEAYTLANGTIQACYQMTNVTRVCEQGNVPTVAVNASTVSDIQAAVKFAAKRNLRLVVKNTGHDFIGRSAGRGGLMVWTHNMKNISYNGTFTPDGAPSNVTYDAFTFGAGVQWFEAYNASQAANRYLVGGIALTGSVGAAGGWVQGGGHSILSPTYGLGVDNAVQMTVVTASGDYLICNDYQNTDLFWALRGGGGGTWGIVTSVTYRTHPLTPVVMAFFAVNSTDPGALLEAFTDHFAMLPNLSDAGWGGYGSFAGQGISKQQMSFYYMNPNVSLAEANATWLPYYASVAEKQSLGLNISYNYTVEYSSFYIPYDEFFGSGDQNGVNSYAGTRLIPRETIDNATSNALVTTALFSIPGAAWNLIAGGAVNRVDPNAVSVGPAWRISTVEATWGAVWADGASAAEIAIDGVILKTQEAILAVLTPQSATYFNEASPFEADFQNTFWGSHYDRLKSIKEKYDPNDLFIVRQGVGSEAWDGTLTCRV